MPRATRDRCVGAGGGRSGGRCVGLPGRGVGPGVGRGGGSGTVVEKYCGSCDGKGTNKKSKQLTITIPPGVEDGNRLRVRGEGDAGPKGGPSGDLYVFLSVTADPRFRREGMDIYSDVSISYLDAILGRVKRVRTIDGQVDIKIPAGTQPGTVLRVKGKGAPELSRLSNRGDQFVTVKVNIPKTLTDEEKGIIEQLDSVSAPAS